MSQKRLPAVFMRGGSSKGVFFHASDLPDNRESRDKIFLSVLGSPDPYGRQLNGMGGGISSLSKAVVINPSSRTDADIDYTFAQIAVRDEIVDYSSNCGNLSSAVGPFSIDTGLIEADGEYKEIIIYNTNSNKLIRSRVPVIGGCAKVSGAFSIPGVSGTGSKIQLDFLDPGGTTTGALLPSGNASDTLRLHNHGEFEVSLVDSSVPCVFVAAERLGLTGGESIEELESSHTIMTVVEQIRVAAGVKMGLGKSTEKIPPTIPKVGIVAQPLSYLTLAGTPIDATKASLTTRIWSMGQVHRVLPLTGAMCLATACRIPGTICQKLSRFNDSGIKLANPSGILPLDAEVDIQGETITARHVTAYRTARTLMEGHILIP
ncbi:MAG: PrpF family protein [Rhodospirillaceae bacterium]|nr:PrpF family protein [Rhodospirillaceae bacterium]|tara:strand:+ start:778 stop:1905 length:1128 start_codon:yes stop_codon:yes gene_type:complete